MKKNLLFSILLSVVSISGAVAAVDACGPGYVLVDSRQKVDGMSVAECQKLWCRDLELNRAMGSGDKAYAGYQATNNPVELCDVKNNCIECWGERKWCSGADKGEWNPGLGVYTRNGADDITYLSYLRSECYDWRLEKPTCAVGQTAIMIDGKWSCSVSSSDGTVSRDASVRRTGSVRRIGR